MQTHPEDQLQRAHEVYGIILLGLHDNANAVLNYPTVLYPTEPPCYIPQCGIPHILNCCTRFTRLYNNLAPVPSL